MLTYAVSARVTEMTSNLLLRWRCSFVLLNTFDKRQYLTLLFGKATSLRTLLFLTHTALFSSMSYYFASLFLGIFFGFVGNGAAVLARFLRGQFQDSASLISLPGLNFTTVSVFCAIRATRSDPWFKNLTTISRRYGYCPLIRSFPTEHLRPLGGQAQIPVRRHPLVSCKATLGGR